MTNDNKIISIYVDLERKIIELSKNSELTVKEIQEQIVKMLDKYLL